MRNYLRFLALLLLVAILLRIDLFFNIAYLFVAVYLLSRLWVQHTNRSLKARRDFTSHAFLGERIDVELTVTNPGLLPTPGLAIYESLPSELAASQRVREAVALAAAQTYRTDYTLNCQKRGKYAVGPLQIKINDPLGILNWPESHLEAEFLTVFPKIIPLQRLGLPTNSPLASLPAATSLFEDPTHVTGLRDYIPGDSPRRIHWTATARSGQMLVKQYKAAVARETLICLDLDRESYGFRYRYYASELAITTAASLAHHICEQEGLSAGLSLETYDPEDGSLISMFFPPRPGRGYLLSILETLAQARLTDGSQFAETLHSRSMQLPWGSTVVAVTGKNDENLQSTLVTLQKSGLAVALILVYPDPESRSQPVLLGLPVYEVWTEDDIEQRL